MDQESKQPNGEGIMEYINGDIYDGERLNSQRHGNGIMIYAGGETYDGEWQYIGWTAFQTGHGGWRGNYYGTSVGDVFEGYGSFEFDNGDRFEGIFHNNEFWQGMYTYHDGTQRKIDMGRR